MLCCNTKGESVQLGALDVMYGGVRYSPILAPLKETGFKGKGEKLHNISTFRFLCWYLALDFGLPEVFSGLTDKNIQYHANSQPVDIKQMCLCVRFVKALFFTGSSLRRPYIMTMVYFVLAEVMILMKTVCRYNKSPHSLNCSILK